MSGMYERLAYALWDIISVMNGNPDLHMSAPRFLMALFFLTLLYLTIRMRAMAQFKPHQIVALAGCVLMMMRELVMLVFLSGWELGVYSDPIVHFLFPPIEHFFLAAALGCFSWYTLEASQWAVIRNFAARTYVYFGTGLVLFSVYALVMWKALFTIDYPAIVHMYRDSPVDWQTHLIMVVIALVSICAAYMRRQGTSYLLSFWIVTFIEHSARAVVFAFFDEQPWQATIFHTMHTWAIPLLLLHFINAYVLKMSQCKMCQREVFLGKLQYETLHGHKSKER